MFSVLFCALAAVTQRRRRDASRAGHAGPRRVGGATRRRADRRRLAGRRPSSPDSSSATRGRGSPRPSQTEARVAYDATAIYIAVQALDPEPVAHRRHPHAARRAIAVGLDPRDHRLVPRSPHRVRVRGESRPASSRTRYWFNDGNNDDGLGRRVGRRRVARRARLARGVPDSVLAAALPRGRVGDVRLRGHARRSRASTRRRPGRCCRRAPTGTCRRSAS